MVNSELVPLSSFKFHTQRGHARLRFTDGQGRDLEGHAVLPMAAFTADLIAEIASRSRGKLRGFSVDLGRGVLRATIDKNGSVEVVRIDGRDFEREIRPRSGALIEWAEYHFGGKLEPDWS
ncbi:hypothetical protein G6O69_21385 [Pseudenhygromyxa sp. WMMC2535]|uniref:hypothetical protein n=1 Tax=Pseudenhygromyxa sp. WMMC2535 TaxID=2712867 RepID=UPI001557A110|nr:hypothetical protein [Pseudenhygromyxa sp. WMMC2535]NVB40407.1 hypothetical protein [Pseudenhygromyxa sp. WMMC2535]